MGDMYYEGYSYYGELDLMEFFLAYFAILGVIWLISIASYVLQSLSLYTIAKRRCIKKPWLAWLPVGYSWILGSIADQYRYVTKGQVTARRKALLVLEILSVVLTVAFFALLFDMIGDILAFGAYALYPDALIGDLLGTFFGAWLCIMVANGLKIAILVISYVAEYDLYRSCEPKNAVLYLVLGIVIFITRPIFMIISSRKDNGMPPRKPQSAAAPQYAQPAPVAAQPAPVAVPQPQPVQEPWEKPEEE